MKLRSFRLRNIGPFADVALDLDALPGTVIAVCGENGAGKTSLLELSFAAALYRCTPTQGTPKARARSRDALIEARIGDLLIRHHVDPQGSGKVLVKRDGAARPEVESAGVRDFERWSRERLPAEELFFASVFGAQGAGGFLSMTAADRKRVLLRALGIERYEVLARRANERWSAAADAAGAIAGKLAGERARTVPLASAEAVVASAQQALDAAIAGTKDARRDLAGAQAMAATRDALVAQARAHQERLDELGIDWRTHDERRDRADARRRHLAAKIGDAAQARAIAATVDERRAALQELERAVAAAEDHAQREAALVAEEAAALERVTELQRRRARAGQDLAGQDEARRWAARAPELREALAAAEQAGREAAQAMAEAERAGREASQAAMRALRVRSDEQERAARARQRIVALAGVEAAEQALPELRARAAETAAVERAADVEVERLRGLVVDGKSTRITFLRGGLALVRDEGTKEDASASLLALSAGEALTEDDALDTEHAAAPDLLKRAREIANAAEDDAEQAERALRDAELLAARRPELDAARTERDAALAAAEQADAAQAEHEARAEDAASSKARHKALVEEHARTTARLRSELSEAERAERRLPEMARIEATIVGLEEQLVAAHAAHQAAIGRVRALGEPPPWPADEQLEAARAALERAEDAAARLPEIAAAEATIAELDEQIAREVAALAALDERIAALGLAPEVPAAPDLAAAEEAVRAAEQAHREAVAAHARAEQVLTAAREAAGRIADLQRELAAAEQLAADWMLVARGLGRDGVQALCIDAAGEEITTVANDLLRTCFGNRWTATVHTTRARADGDGDMEVCDVLVYDAVTGEERDGRLFSGGERGILNEALALTLSLISCRRAGLSEPTLVRDETGAALDEEMGERYIHMLRRAAVIVNASKIFFVTHNPRLWAMADARVVVRDGQIFTEAGSAGWSVAA